MGQKSDDITVRRSDAPKGKPKPDAMQDVVYTPEEGFIYEQVLDLSASSELQPEGSIKKIDNLTEVVLGSSLAEKESLMDDLTEDFDEATNGPSLATLIAACKEQIKAGKFLTVPVEESRREWALIEERAALVRERAKAVLAANKRTRPEIQNQP